MIQRLFNEHLDYLEHLDHLGHLGNLTKMVKMIMIKGGGTLITLQPRRRRKWGNGVKHTRRNIALKVALAPVLTACYVLH